MQSPLDVVQILDDLIEIAVLRKIVPHPLKPVQLRRTLRRNRCRLVQRNLRRHRTLMLRCRICNKTPRVEFIVNECTLSTMRANTREFFYFCATLLANHIIPPYC